MYFDLKNWRRDWTLMSVFFNGDEIASITEKLKYLKTENVVLCSLENRFAKGGGLASVTTNILPYLKEVNNIPTVMLMTPLYPRIMNTNKVSSTGILFNVPFNNQSIQVEIYEYIWKYSKPARGELKEYFLKADSFFQASNRLGSPYVYHEKDTLRNDAAMNENALFFCKATPLAVSALGIRENIVFHLHEWQTSLISLTAKEAMLKGTLKSCGTVQTMHNSYDSSISWESVIRLVNKSRRQRLTEYPGQGLTAYQIGLQLVDAPVTTVSDTFAKELTSDIIQTEYYAPHLQNILRKSQICGINNGLFVEFTRIFPKREKHTVDEIRKIKLRHRKALLRILTSYIPKERFGRLTYHGRTISKLPENIPIIVMSGRLDPTQKGYYVLLRAIEQFSEDEIKVILTPMPVNLSDLDYFYEVACKCEGNVTVFPIKMERGYNQLQAGSTFGVMPSIYEPFGAAVEYMVSGTVNIGRATGGLLDQIDYTCGFLYKEDAVFYTPEYIEDFVDSADIVQMRKTNPWSESMADNLYTVLKKAIDVYQNHPEEYYQMIINGFEKANRFNWETNAKKYFQVYEVINKV